MQPEELLLEHLSSIEQIVRSVCRGRGMDSGRVEDFDSFVKLRLVDNDYAIIRAFKGRSSFGTFMTTVVTRLLNDYRNHVWGKWRSSAEAKRLGDLAIELERLLIRDGWSLDEALGFLRPRFPAVTRETLGDLAMAFPARYRRKLVELEDGPEPRTAEESDGVESEETAARISSVVKDFIARLPEGDQIIFQLRFGDGMPVPQIAKSLRQDAQALYRLLRTHFADLRRALEAAGIGAADVAKLIGSDAAHLDFHLKSAGPRPSNGDEPGAAPEEDA